MNAHLYLLETLKTFPENKTKKQQDLYRVFTTFISLEKSDPCVIMVFRIEHLHLNPFRNYKWSKMFAKFL